MKPGTNNEIDILLRKLSRRQGTESDSAYDAEATRLDEEHLDTDELSSYAENALPAAARARYTAHLAECSNCRKIVVQLSLASSSVVQEKAAGVPERSSLWKYLATLFSPLVLRYAVPALSLIAIVAIGLVVFQRQTREDFVAKNIELQTRPTVSQGVPAENTTDTKPSAGVVNAERSNSTSNNKVVESRPEGTPVSNAAADDSRQESKEKKADAPVVAAQPVFAAEPPPAAPKSAIAENEAQRKTEAPEKTKQAEVDAYQSGAKDLSKSPAKEEDRSKDEVAARRAAKTQSPSTVGGVAASSSVARERGRADAEKSGKDEAFRSVAGRRFRKEGRVWIDTAYESSRSTVSLTRGSEQFRALVADEPEIQTIADQLDGEIIVVWKNRAYRIR